MADNLNIQVQELSINVKGYGEVIIVIPQKLYENIEESMQNMGGSIKEDSELARLLILAFLKDIVQKAGS